jgi:uncharacterized membrane protein (DUF485 family)
MEALKNDDTADDLLSVADDEVPPVVMVHATSRRVEEFVAGRVDGELYFKEARRAATMRAVREVEQAEKLVTRKTSVGPALSLAVGIVYVGFGVLAGISHQWIAVLFSLTASIGALAISAVALKRARG